MKVGVGQHADPQGALARHGAHPDVGELLGRRHTGNRPQQHPVGEAEDRRRRAEPDCQRQDSRRKQAGAAPETPEGVQDILPQGVEQGRHATLRPAAPGRITGRQALVTRCPGNMLEITEATLGVAHCLLLVHSRTAIVRGATLDVEAQLLFDLERDLFSEVAVAKRHAGSMTFSTASENSRQRCSSASSCSRPVALNS